MLFTKPHDLSKLHDEILARYPELKGVVRVEGWDDGRLRLTLPDNVPDPGLAAVVAVHDPSKPAKGEAEQKAREAVLTRIKADPASATIQDLLNVLQLV